MFCNIRNTFIKIMRSVATVWETCAVCE